jgi:hypothetical protein
VLEESMPWKVVGFTMRDGARPLTLQIVNTLGLEPGVVHQEILHSNLVDPRVLVAAA